jgi:hypothetical protein
MDESKVKSIIDNKIISLLDGGNSVTFVIKEITSKIDKFIDLLEKENININDAISDVYSLKSSRHRYVTFYIIVVYKRIKDLKWMINNYDKFKNLNNTKLFKLVQFKDKISKENSLPF